MGSEEMTDAISQIKAELERINIDNEYFLKLFSDTPTNMKRMIRLSKALSVAVEALSGYQEGCMVDKKFIPNDAMSAIKTIAKILSGEGDGK